MFFHPSAFFCLPAAGVSSCSRLHGTQGARPDPIRKLGSLGPGRGPWHVLWGFKVARPLGEAFRARRAIQAHANPRTYYIINRLENVQSLMWYLGSWMSSMSSDIAYLVMEEFFPDTTTMPDIRLFKLYSINLRPSFVELIHYKPTRNHHNCVPHLRNKFNILIQTNPQPNPYVFLFLWYY